ncbi:hypothetical protein [Lysobacter gummosus]
MEDEQQHGIVLQRMGLPGHAFADQACNLNFETPSRSPALT